MSLAQQQQPRFSPAAYPQAAARYVPSSQSSRNNRTQLPNDQCKFTNEINYLFILLLFS